MGIIKTNHPLSVKKSFDYSWEITKLLIIYERHATHCNKEKKCVACRFGLPR